MAKLYKSRIWLSKKYLIDKLSVRQIAELCGGASENTIRAYLREFKIIP